MVTSYRLLDTMRRFVYPVVFFIGYLKYCFVQVHALPAGTPSFPLPPDGSWNPARRSLLVQNHADTVTLMNEVGAVFMR